MKVLFKKSDAVEPFSFRFTDNDGNIILKSENYKAKPSALNGIESVKKNASSEKRYELKTAKNGKFYFNLKSTNGQVIGTSPMFDDEEKRQSVIEFLSGNAVSAELDDQSAEVPAGQKGTSKASEPEAAVKKSKSAAEVTKRSKKDAAAKPAEKSSEKSSDVMMTDIAEEQFDATTETILTALNTLNAQLDEAREKGSLRGKEIVRGIGGDNKMAKLIEDLAGYMGEATSVGITMGTTPMVVMAGAAKGIYKKITK